MMKARGHEVILYASEDNEAQVNELVTVVGKKQQAKWGFNGPTDYLGIDFNDPQIWGPFNTSVISQLNIRLKPRDFICVITGTPAQAIKDAFPNNTTVEYGIGYSGIMNPSFRVYESNAWRNYVYGKYNLEGAFYDEVIPNYFEVDDFPLAKKKNDYYLFVGRINANKGLQIAQDVCEHLGKRLVVAGPGSFSGYGEYVGVVDPKERGELMSKAQGQFVPTLYVPPFEGVHIEANLCGTPVITTDFGVFTETVENGVNGYRCRTMAEFIEAAQKVKTLDFGGIRKTAREKYSLEAISEQYEEYFERLLTLWDKGFYTGL
jgi:glycosyltransferase involved in cell wall biosynthesis